MLVIGTKYHRWTTIGPIEITERKGPGRLVCLSRCECGTERRVYTAYLLNGHSKSCGCLKRELTSARFLRHGYAKKGLTQEYLAWQSMKTRCNNKKSTAYKDYGGRGITVCERWMLFDNFIADMGKKPDPSLTLDRKENSGNYEPGNCKWATRSEQAYNRRGVRHRFMIEGKEMTLDEVAVRLGVKRKAVEHRINRGWTVERILSQPFRRSRTAS